MDHSDPGLKHLNHLGLIARTARSLLAEAIARGGGRLSDPDKLDTALTHLSHVREGFLITVRTSQFRSGAELRAVVRAILVDWGWLAASGIRWEGMNRPIEKPVIQVLAFGHAATALGAMRHLPPQEVTFPHAGRTYADIPVPRSPGEMLERIEEMEGLIAGGASRPLKGYGREWVRRTYGYFETGAWLVERHGGLRAAG